MYRPLYWFGERVHPQPESLALAGHGRRPTTAPATRSTIDLDNYKWSNGETVTAENVMFWMNMLHAEKANWAGYSAGALPDDVKSIVINNPEQLTFTLTGPVNNYWFTYNELSQITPCPTPGTSPPRVAPPTRVAVPAAPYGTADTQCKAVYTFLSKQSGYDPSNPKAANNSLSTYATNPDLAGGGRTVEAVQVRCLGQRDLRAQSHLLGTDQADVKKFVELPFTSDSAEFNALVGGKVTWATSHPGHHQAATNNALKAGPNNPRLSNFTLGPLYGWAINYFPYNFNSTGDNGNAGPIFKQLYFRQAVQYLVDQPLYNKKIFKGYSRGDLRSGPVHAGQLLRVPGGPGQPLPVQPGQGRHSAEGPRLEGRAQRHLHLHVAGHRGQ